jgi:putative membrane protein
MIRNMINGFCMALADSVPGVSGGTVAFIMGFYDRFIGSIDDLVFGKGQQRKAALIYLLKLGLGWLIGMGIASTILGTMFTSHIYFISSVFIGFIAGAIPIVIMEEKKQFKPRPLGLLFFALGIGLVVAVTVLNGGAGKAAMDLGVFSAPTAVKLFFIGMIAISAMFLPGISGSTLLLVFGAYIPVITAVHHLFALNFSYLPMTAVFGVGIICGAMSVVKVIRLCLERYRSQTLWFILGMMIGSFYAIVQGPTTLKIPQAPLSLSTFSAFACLIGVALVFLMQLAKGKKNQKPQKIGQAGGRVGEIRE